MTKWPEEKLMTREEFTSWLGDTKKWHLFLNLYDEIQRLKKKNESLLSEINLLRQELGLI